MSQPGSGATCSTVSLARARDRDPQALAQLVRSLTPRLTRMALHYARGAQEEADDLLQEAWAGVLEALPALDVGIGQPEQYLVRVARWRLLDARRRASARAALDARADLEQVPCPRQADAPSAVETADFIGTLRPMQRAVVACLLAGMTWREVGAALGCTSANVAYHMRQIRKAYAAWRSA